MMESKGVTLQDRVMAPICCHLLKICYFIAFIDLLQSLYFLIQSFGLLTVSVNLYSIAAFLGSVFWIFMVGLLLMGLWKGRLPFIIGWLCFSFVGIVLDILFFIWTIYISQQIEWSQIIRFTLLYFGIVFEWLCVYIVYHYCLRIKSPVIHEPENGNAKPHHFFRIHKKKSRSSKLESSDEPEKEKSRRSMESEHGKNSRKSKTETSDQSGPKTDSHQSKEKEKSNKRDGKGNENKKNRNSKR
ncbi:hypothetical protein ACLKA6_011670 [Drosophila palustris]